MFHFSLYRVSATLHIKILSTQFLLNFEIQTQEISDSEVYRINYKMITSRTKVYLLAGEIRTAWDRFLTLEKAAC